MGLGNGGCLWLADHTYTSHTSLPHPCRYFGYADAQEGVTQGHGTHVCGSVAGYPAEMSPTTKSFQYRGAAYMSKLAFFDIGVPNDDYLYIPPDLSTGFFPRTYNLGGRIHSNSWGSSISTNSEEMYQTDKYLWEHQDFLIIYAAGNEGQRGARTVGTPALSKNSISVGATTNGVVNPDVAYFSSRGPTFDMRFGIDVCAPVRVACVWVCGWAVLSCGWVDGWRA